MNMCERGADRPIFGLALCLLCLLALVVACGSASDGGRSGSTAVDAGDGDAGSGSGDGDVDGGGDGDINASGFVPDEPDLFGVGTGNDFDIDTNPTDGVGLDPSGALVVERDAGGAGAYLWVADTGGNKMGDNIGATAGVYKIEMETMAIVGHYAVGGHSPSRTTVNALGEAFVGSREGSFGVTKILPGDCPDRNGNGIIDTSTGLGDVLPFLQDECVAWYTETPGDVRGLAAQDISGLTANACDGYDPNTMEFAVDPNDKPDQHYVWASSFNGNRLWKLDSATGAILIDLPWPDGQAGYGLALGGDGKLWTAKHVTFLDTLQCTDQATCEAAPFCDFECEIGNCPNICEGSVKGRFPNNNAAYGVTVDCSQRIWFNGQSSGGTFRLDPSLPANERYAVAPIASGDGGIAADSNGWVWVGFHNADRMWRIDANTMEVLELPIRAKGMAIRPSDGHVLVVEHRTGGEVDIHEIDPGATINDAVITRAVQHLPDDVYAYSDMNGVQTALASNEPSWYRQIFAGCDEGPTRWDEFAWDVEVPDGTWVMIKLRAANNMEDLEGAEWSTLGCHVADSQDAAIIDYIDARYIEIELRFTAIAGAGCGMQGDAASARILSFGPTRGCEPELFGPG